MKALITGGAGFIGSNLTNQLLEQNHSVTILDNLSSGYKENLDGLKVEFINGDITDKHAVETALQGKDVVFHFAASVGRQKSLDEPVKDSEINLIGTVNILEGMRKKGVKKIVYASSAAIFGELLTPTIDEDHPQNADSPYGVSKLAAEKMILAYSGIYDIVGVCLRYFNIYGKNQRFDLYGNVIPIFAKRIAEGKKIGIYGDGLQTRDFLNVIDVARANIIAAEKADKSGVYNVGSATSITINTLAEMMTEISGKDVGIEYLPTRPADVLHCKANIDKVQKELGFSPTVELEQGLKDYLEWFFNDMKKQ